MLRLVVYLIALGFVVSTTFGQTVTDDKALAELSKRPPQESESIKTRAANLENLDEKGLRDEYAAFQKLHDQNRDAWMKVQAARRAEGAAAQAVEARSAKYALQLWQNQREFDSKMQALQDAEHEKFQSKFNESYSTVSPKLAQWKDSPEYKQISLERAEADKKFREKVKSINDDAARGNVQKAEKLDTIQQQVLTDFQVTGEAVRKARELIEAIEVETSAANAVAVVREAAKKLRERKQLQATPPKTNPADLIDDEDPFKPPRYNLNMALSTPGVGQEGVEINQVFDLGISVTAGVPPFSITIVAPETGIQTMSLTELGSLTAPMMFRKPMNPCSIQVVVQDKNSMHRKMSVQVKVSEKKATTEKPDTGTKSSDNSSVPQQPAPTPPLLTPLDGPYRASLWCVQVIPVPGDTQYLGRIEPVPVHLNFDPSGAVQGKCDYTAPRQKFSPEFRKNYPSSDWRITFTVSGSVDWKTGILSLSIPDIRHSRFEESQVARSEWTHVAQANLQGNHITAPYWDQFLMRMAMVAPMPGMSPLYQYELRGSPNVEIGADGKYHFVGDGWFGAPGAHPGIAPSTGMITQMVLKLTASDVTLSKDLTNDYKRASPNLSGWYLKLLDKEATAGDLVQKDLVATTIWPERVEQVGVSELVFVDFMGVFSDDYKPKDLTHLCEWKVPDGVIQVRPGVFRATRAGTFLVSARAKGKSSNWMEGFVTIEAK